MNVNRRGAHRETKEEKEDLPHQVVTEKKAGGRGPDDEE